MGHSRYDTKPLILGAGGLIGSALARQLPNSVKTYHKSPTATNIDITEYNQLLGMFDAVRPTVVFLCAANANVDACESIDTNKVNIQGALTVLRLCEQFESKIVYFSSSYVFNGKSRYPYTPDEEPHPINNYGIQKETVERLILESYAKFVIVRTVGVFGRERHARNFAKQVVGNIFSNKKVMVPDDQYVNPILADDLAHITIQLADRHNGIWHVAGDTCMTKYEFGRKLAGYFDLEKLVVPVASCDLKQRAERPRMGCLDSYSLEEVGLPIPSFEAGLLHFLEMEMV